MYLFPVNINTLIHLEIHLMVNPYSTVLSKSEELMLTCFCFVFVFFVLQLATWDSVHGLNGSLKESRIENGMQGVTVKVVTLLVMLTFIIVTFKKYLCFVGVDIIVLIRAQNLQPSNSAEFNRIGTFLIHKVLNTPKLFHVCLHILLANIIITLFETVTAC